MVVGVGSPSSDAPCFCGVVCFKKRSFSGLHIMKEICCAKYASLVITMKFDTSSTEAKIADLKL